MPRFTRIWSLIFFLLCLAMSSAVADSIPSAEIADFIGLHNIQAVTKTQDKVSFLSNSLNRPLGPMAPSATSVSSHITSGIPFYFTSAFNETITVWSGANKTGTLLATFAISPNHLPCTGFPSYCNWNAAGLAIAFRNGKSISFASSADGFGIDLNLNSSTSAIPEPSPIYLVAAGLAASGFERYRRFFRN